jgi:hypothetical protein
VLQGKTVIFLELFYFELFFIFIFINGQKLSLSSSDDKLLQYFDVCLLYETKCYLSQTRAAFPNVYTIFHGPIYI